jgi:hypothetical protein
MTPLDNAVYDLSWYVDWNIDGTWPVLYITLALHVTPGFVSTERYASEFLGMGSGVTATLMGGPALCAAMRAGELADVLLAEATLARRSTVSSARARTIFIASFSSRPKAAAWVKQSEHHCLRFGCLEAPNRPTSPL